MRARRREAAALTPVPAPRGPAKLRVAAESAPFEQEAAEQASARSVWEPTAAESSAPYAQAVTAREPSDAAAQPAQEPQELVLARPSGQLAKAQA